jgi:hypothetical protein
LLFVSIAMVGHADARGTAPAVTAPRIVAFAALAEFARGTEAKSYLVQSDNARHR